MIEEYIEELLSIDDCPYWRQFADVVLAKHNNEFGISMLKNIIAIYREEEQKQALNYVI